MRGKNVLYLIFIWKPPVCNHKYNVGYRFAIYILTKLRNFLSIHCFLRVIVMKGYSISSNAFCVYCYYLWRNNCYVSCIPIHSILFLYKSIRKKTKWKSKKMIFIGRTQKKYKIKQNKNKVLPNVGKCSVSLNLKNMWNKITKY